MDSGLIFDIGVNNGDDSSYYLYRGYRVVGVEANPTLNEALKIRFEREIKDQKFILVEGAISLTPAPVRFYINDWIDEWSASNKDIAGRSGLPVTGVVVEGITIESLFEKYGVPFYLKSDIEGGDAVVLESLTKDTLPSYFSVEATCLDYLKKLYEFGYSKFKCIDQQDHNSPDTIPKFKDVKSVERIKRPLRRLFSSHPLFGTLFRWSGLSRYRQKRRFDEIVKSEPQFDKNGRWIFPRASSGPFAEASFGQWRSFEDVAKDYSAWKVGDFQNTSLSRDGWFDFHATL